MKRILIFVSLILSSCASATKVTLPSGQKGFSIDCSGTAIPVSKCIEKAGEVCPNGYEVISSHNESGTMFNPFQGNGQYIPTSHKGMMISCN